VEWGVSLADTHLDQLISDGVLDAAYAWVCCARRDWPPCADIWNFRRDWTKEKRQLKAELVIRNMRVLLMISWCSRHALEAARSRQGREQGIDLPAP
jgi:hypothetical protein